MEFAPHHETFGETFPTFMIELVANSGAPVAPALLLWDGTNAHIESTLRLVPDAGCDFKPRVYEPPKVDPTIWSAVRLPTHAADYGTTPKLFDDICRTILERSGLGQDAASLVAHTVLASWFSDCAPVPVRLSIVGDARSRAGLQLFRLLGCLYRHALVLGPCGLTGVASLPQELCPSLFIERQQHDGPTDNLLRALNAVGTYVPRKNGLVHLSAAAQVTYSLKRLPLALSGSEIELAVPPSSRPLPTLDRSALDQIAREFQPKLLTYRMRNFRQVLAGEFTPPDVVSAWAEVASWLGRCVPGQPELQKTIGALLRAEKKLSPVRRFVNLNQIVVHVLLSICHRDPKKEKLYVGELAEAVHSELERRGEHIYLSPRSLGERLKDLDIWTEKLDGKGRGIYLGTSEREEVHELAFKYDVLQRGPSECRECPKNHLPKTTGAQALKTEGGRGSASL